MDGTAQGVKPTRRAFTRFKVVTDGAGWSLDWDARHVAQALEGLGLRRTRFPGPKTLLYFTSRDHFLRYAPLMRFMPSRTIIVDHFHGTPLDDSKYIKYFDAYKKYKEKLFGIRITNTEVQKFFEQEGLGDLCHIVTIPVDTNLFSETNIHKYTRADFGISEDSVVLGSFQKDGLGWGTGLEPKLEKGPDLLVSAILQLDQLVERLHVLLTGPARGYVYHSLQNAGVTVSWRKNVDYVDMPGHYGVLDAYIIASRLEGGPKAALESLAAGVPLASTPVGQVPEIGLGRCHGIITSGFETDALAAAVLDVLRDGGDLACKKELANQNNLVAFQLNLESWLPGR